MTCKTCGGRRVVTYIADTCNPEREGPCPSCVGIKIAGGDAIPAGVSAVMGRILGHYGEDPGTLARIKGMVAQYREAPFRSAEWLAGEIMRILDSEPANDTTPKPPAGGDAAAREALERALDANVPVGQIDAHVRDTIIANVIGRYDAALALPAPVVEGDVEKEARFLCERLAEFEREITDDDLFTQFNGHVAPSAARLRAALSEGRSHG